jgi:elongation factor Ts
VVFVSSNTPGVDDVDVAALEAEREVLMEVARKSGKPDNIVEKIVAGQMNKYYEQVCLTQQPFVSSSSDPVAVSKVCVQKAKDWGLDSVDVKHFVRMQCGEGIAKEEKQSFAEEVQGMMQK